MARKRTDADREYGRRYQERMRRIKCRYCKVLHRGNPCAGCEQALQAMRSSKRKPKTTARRAPEAVNVASFIDGLEPVPTVPHFGYVSRRYRS